MLATRNLTAPVSFEFDGELLHHVVCQVAQTILENVGLMSFQLGGAHQLRISNTTKAGKSVKTGRRETSSKQQLLGIHYCFATGLQEKAWSARFQRADAKARWKRAYLDRELGRLE
jgi:hypothetical protein